MKQPISVVITCSDNSHRLSKCVDRCLNFADEILIAECVEQIDAHAIARQDNRIRVVAHEQIRGDDFLNWTISQASNEWVLLLDSDEKLNQSLADEIELVLSRGATHDAYAIKRDTFVNGKRQEAAISTGSRKIRLFRADQAFCTQTGSARTVEVESGRVGKLSNRISRHPDWRFERALETLTTNATEDARRWHEQGKRASVTNLLLAPAYQFAVQYFWRGSIFDGVAGIRCSWQAAFQCFCTYACLSDLGHESNTELKAEPTDPATIDLLDPTFRRAA